MKNGCLSRFLSLSLFRAHKVTMASHLDSSRSKLYVHPSLDDPPDSLDVHLSEDQQVVVRHAHLLSHVLPSHPHTRKHARQILSTAKQRMSR